MKTHKLKDKQPEIGQLVWVWSDCATNFDKPEYYSFGTMYQMTWSDGHGTTKADPEDRWAPCVKPDEND